MAILKQRLNRKNSSGTYDTVYLENIATNIKMSDTDSTLLSTKISNMDTAINGKQPAGSYAAASHNHSAANITSGTLAVAHGGTGQTSVDTTPTSGSKKMCTSGGIYTAINELKTSVSNGKSAVASAITDKGVSTSATASFNTMANNIRKIVTSNIYTINNFNNELISDDKITHCPCYEYGGGYITYHAENTSLEHNKTYFYFNMKLNNYTQVELYTGANNYPLRLLIYEYNPGDFSTLVLKASNLYGYYNGYHDLGFTTDPNKLYLLRVSGGNYYMGCRFK